MDSLGERTQLIITLFQLILVIALGYDTTTRLEPELAITTDKGTDNDGLIEITIQSDESDTTAISTSVVRLQSEIICMARTLGAPLSVPAGKVSINSLI